MTNRNAEYDEAVDKYEESQVDMYVSELLLQIQTLKATLKDAEASTVTLHWVESVIIQLAHDFKQ